jgi:hypothetical protein
VTDDFMLGTVRFGRSLAKIVLVLSYFIEQLVRLWGGVQTLAI